MYYCPGNYWSFERLKGDLQNKLNTLKKKQDKRKFEECWNTNNTTDFV